MVNPLRRSRNPPRRTRRRRIGAIFQNDLRARTEPGPLAEIPAVAPILPDKNADEPGLKDLAIQAGKKILKEKVLNEEPAPKPPPPPPPDELKAPRDTIAIIYATLGFIAMILGVVSWVKKDHIRISGAAISLGLMAVAWQYVLIGVCIAIVIMILASLS